MVEESKKENQDVTQSDEKFGPLFHILKDGTSEFSAFEKKYSSELVLTKRILGAAAENVYPIYALHEKTYFLYMYFVPRFMNLPATDLAGIGLSKALPPVVRSACTYAASKDFNCRYCTAHCCSLGNIFAGARVQEGVTPDKIDPKLTDVAVDLVRKANYVPSTVTKEDVNKAIEKYETRGNVIQIATFAASLGWMNYFQRIMGAEAEQFFLNGGKKKQPGFFSNLFSIMKVLNGYRNYKKKEETYFEKFPLKNMLYKDQQEYIEKMFGFVPLWFENMHILGREALSLFLEENLLKGTSGGTFSSLTRVKLFYLFTSLTGDEYLNDCAAMMAKKIHDANLRKELVFTEDEKVLKILVEKSYTMPHDELDKETSLQFEEVCKKDRSEMVQIISTIGFFWVLRRISNIVSLMDVMRSGKVSVTSEQHMKEVKNIIKGELA
eukprot:snap_masked-scaffold_11-processed-gene-4.0-mRNA-1 protein AED:1.00 eAED:1.00 QI:0/-1/0/0/-1/1/1/0/437